MFRLRYLLSALVCITSCHSAVAQTNTPIVNVGGLATNSLSTPGRPTSVTGSSGCSTGTQHNYSYEVAGVDFNGGLTPYGNPSTPTVSCGALGGTIGSTPYVFLTLPAVAGAQSCYVTRILDSSPQYMGNFPCGTNLFDYGQTSTALNAPTSTNTTGGVAANGFVNAQAFFAKGAGAGTDVLNTGTGLSTCSSTAGLPCISSASQIFLQAPTSVSPSSWGITLPSAAPSTTAGNYPFLLGKLDTTQPAPASAAIVGTLSNPSATELATATGTFTANDFVMWDANSNANAKDSGISTVAIANSVLGNPTGSSASAVYTSAPSLSSVTAGSYGTATNCASSASPAACSSAASGAVVIPTGTNPVTLIVDTTAVTANSIILIGEDSGLAGRFTGVTCNTSLLAPFVASRVAGTSFTVKVTNNITTNPVCMSYLIVN